RLDAVDEPEHVHVLDDLLPGLEAVQTRVLARGRRHFAVEADDRANRQLVAPTDLEVHGVVAGRDLDDAGAELRVHRRVGDHFHADVAVDGGDVEGLADVLLVAFVLGMDGEAGVAEFGLWPHGAERERTVLDVDELGVALLALDLEVREHRLTTRAPVDDVVVAIDQLLGIQAHEDLAHRARKTRVHREALVRPIAGGAEPLELADDRAAGLLLPAPHAAQELLTADLVLRLTLGRELAPHG